MKTEIVKEESIEEVIEELKQNRCVIIPTETVYGIGGNALSKEAVENIFAIKERARTNPLNVLIADFEMVNMLATGYNSVEEKIMKKFWPGPLTIILDKKEEVPDIVTGGNKTIGVRIPDCDVTRNIIRKANMPLACPSANLSGKPSGTKVTDIQNEFNEKVRYIVDNGESKLGIESTVVKVIDNKACILRPGFVTKEDFESIGVNAYYDPNIFKKVEKGAKVLSEGMKNKHYVPEIDCYLVKENVVEKILNNADNNKDKKIIVISCTENKSKYIRQNIVEVIDMGSKANVLEIGKNFFGILRSLENKKADYVLIEEVEETGAGLAIMNRILRACEYKII